MTKDTAIRRFPQTLSLLASLLEHPAEWRYGYDLSRETSLQSGTLYPILMRLSERGWLNAKWEEAHEPGRPARHMYRLSADGREWAREQLKADAPAADRKRARKLRPAWERAGL
jgi:PadR family transcriptional regulator, regulatory protein PadR